ncbi:MAG TPA: glycosyltransferase 87 family protein, partial [Candidatus Obscuribacterales bacterium]
MADKSQAPINSLAAYLIALLGIGLAAFIVLGSLANFGAVSDVPEFYAGGWMIAHGNAGQVYNLPVIFDVEKHLFPSLGARGIGLFVPPPGVLLLTPLALLPAGLMAALWTFLLTAALAVSLWLIICHLALSRHQSLWLIGIVFLSGPAVEALRLGQLAPLMLLAVTGAMIVADRRPYLAGVLLDILIVKPQQLFPLLLFFLASCRRQLVVASILVLVLLLALAGLVFGKAGLTLYVVTVADPQNLQLMQPEL